jgi:hypothetical protein
MTRRTGEQGRGVGGMSGRAAAWLAWSLVALSVAWCAGLGIAGLSVGFALRGGPLEDFPQITNPYGVDSPTLEMATVAGGFVVVGSFVASAISLIIRARHTSSASRSSGSRTGARWWSALCRWAAWSVSGA